MRLNPPVVVHQFAETDGRMKRLVVTIPTVNALRKRIEWKRIKCQNQLLLGGDAIAAKV